MANKGSMNGIEDPDREGPFFVKNKLTGNYLKRKALTFKSAKAMADNADNKHGAYVHQIYDATGAKRY
jgi:hypothetical protein